MIRQLREIGRRLDRSLRARILLPTALLFAATLGAMVVSAVEFYEADMDRGLRERAELFASVVAGGIANTMRQGRAGELSGTLRLGTTHRPEVASISAIRPDGTVGSSSLPELLGTRPWGDAIERFDTTQVVTAPDGDDAQYAVVKPIPNLPGCASCHGSAQRLAGWVDLRFTRGAVIAQQAQLTRTLGLSAAAAFVVLMAIAWWLIGWLAVSPLQRLVRLMKRAESGDLSVSADEGRPDELGVAARGFDAMLAALRRSRAELEAFYHERMVRADRFAAVGELATGLAHEIKNPLAGLSGALELLAEDLRGSPRQAEVVGEMQHQVSRLGHTMDGLLSFARPPKTRLRTTDVNATLEKVLFLVAQQRSAAAVAISTRLAEALPPVLADPGQLEQVLLNLCLNACQAMDGRGTLAVRSFEVEGGVAVEIEDDGPGIPPEVRAHVFQPFFTTKRDGTGLGLAISARIVADHGGHIGYRCPATGGTAFTVTLRRAGQAGERPEEPSE